MPLPRLTRFLTLLFAAIQLAAPAVVSVADGAYSRLVREPVTHVESSGGDECIPPHAADCTVCRYLSDGRPGSTSSVDAAVIADAASAPMATTLVVATNDRAPTQSRAPPSV